MHRNEIDRIGFKMQTDRLTLVPLRLYFSNGRGRWSSPRARAERRWTNVTTSPNEKPNARPTGHVTLHCCSSSLPVGSGHRSQRALGSTTLEPIGTGADRDSGRTGPTGAERPNSRSRRSLAPNATARSARPQLDQCALGNCSAVVAVAALGCEVAPPPPLQNSAPAPNSGLRSPAPVSCPPSSMTQDESEFARRHSSSERDLTAFGAAAVDALSGTGRVDITTEENGRPQFSSVGVWTCSRARRRGRSGHRHRGVRAGTATGDQASPAWDAGTVTNDPLYDQQWSDRSVPVSSGMGVHPGFRDLTSQGRHRGRSLASGPRSTHHHGRWRTRGLRTVSRELVASTPTVTGPTWRVSPQPAPATASASRCGSDGHHHPRAGARRNGLRLEHRRGSGNHLGGGLRRRGGEPLTRQHLAELGGLERDRICGVAHWCGGRRCCRQ